MPAPAHHGLSGTVAQRIRIVRDGLPPAELAVIGSLMENYPVGGLVPVAQLAAKAGVSGPTVLRLVGKLGFPGYAAFRTALRGEVETRLYSPVDVYPNGSDREARRGDAASQAVDRAQAALFDGIRATFGEIDPDELERVVELLADESRSIHVLGGRFSSVLATHLGTYLAMLRPGVHTVGSHVYDTAPALLDVDRRSVAVVFDYRRYQQSTIDWALEAARRGAYLVVITDPYLSPLATHAKSLLTSSAAGLPPFDSMTCGFALVELLISRLAQKLGRSAKTRLRSFETLRVREEKTPRTKS